MSFPIHELTSNEFPSLLREIPEPPTSLNYRGTLPSPDMKLLAAVGSRHFTNYGKEAVEYLIAGLRGYHIGIVSGLALGMDSLAHEAALGAKLYTLAVPGGGIDDSVIYPARHKPLARRILEAGGGLLSEYEPTMKAAPWSFPKRNRIVCGMCHATLVIEAAEKSGSLITARLATDYNRELLVVPGSIFSPNSKGTHQFMKLGATPVTTPSDILEILQVEPHAPTTPQPSLLRSPLEEKVLVLLTEPLPRDALVRQLDLATHEAAALLMEMEMNGLIKESAGVYINAA